jgi:DNA-binding XRE family transcriptional regulator
MIESFPSSELKIALREFRQRIDPQSTTLGSYNRLPSRFGRPVTQEEIAEHVGISRSWYGKLESDEHVRASVDLLDRLATTLMLSPDERTTLFSLGLPQLRLTFM